MVHIPPPTTDIVHRVEFCGGIGVGKSAVARGLAAHCGFPLIEESYHSVPFWQLHQQFAGFEFPKNIGFLVVHLEKLFAEAGSASTGPLICDFSFAQMLAYSGIAGSPAEKAAYREVHEILVGRIGKPIAIVHLTCSAQLQIERIVRRARIGETIPKRAFLQQLNEQVSAELSSDRAAANVIRISNASDELGRIEDLSNHIADRIMPLIAQLHAAGSSSLHPSKAV